MFMDAQNKLYEQMLGTPAPGSIAAPAAGKSKVKFPNASRTCLYNREQVITMTDTSMSAVLGPQYAEVDQYPVLYVQGHRGEMTVSTEKPEKDLFFQLPNLTAEDFGDPEIKNTYGLRYALCGGAMANGIASSDMAITLAKRVLAKFEYQQKVRVGAGCTLSFWGLIKPPASPVVMTS